MGLREQAKLDARAILEDASGFAWPVTLVSPLGAVYSLSGFTSDVAVTIDPETGQAVAGRRASAAFARGSLPALPEAIAEKSRRPWLASFADSEGALGLWKVIEVLPDRAAGVVVLLLEAYGRAVDIAGALALPSLQLSGSVVLGISGALALPSLQLSGSLAVAVGALGAFYRKAASTAVGGEWQTIVDILGGASLVQNDTDRRMAADVSANGFPIGIFDGSDVTRMPLHAGNFNTTKFGWSIWLRPVATNSQYFYVIYNNDATTRTLTWGVSTGGALFIEIYIATNVDGRRYQTAGGVVVANAWQYPRFQIDCTRTAECDTTGLITDAKVRAFMGEVAIPLTASNIGLGGVLTTLRTPNLVTGAAIIGGVNDSDTPGAPLFNLTREGPNGFIWTATPTPQQAANVMAFEVPT